MYKIIYKTTCLVKTSRIMAMWRLVLPNNFRISFLRRPKKNLQKIIHVYVLLKNSSILLWLKPSFYKHIIHKCKGTPCFLVSKDIYFLTKTIFLGCWTIHEIVFFCKTWINIKYVHHLNYVKTLKISFRKHFFWNPNV